MYANSLNNTVIYDLEVLLDTILNHLNVTKNTVNTKSTKLVDILLDAGIKSGSVKRTMQRINRQINCIRITNLGIPMNAKKKETFLDNKYSSGKSNDNDQ